MKTLSKTFFTAGFLGALIAPNSQAQSFLKRSEGVAWLQESRVDKVQDKTQLSETRAQKPIDGCLQQQGQPKNFSGAIENAIRLSLDSRVIKTDIHIQEAYGLPTEDKALAVSLLSHPLCEQGAEQLEHVLGKDYVPDAEAISNLKEFTQRSNKARALALKGDAKGLEEFIKTWTTLMGCLAYAESLNTAHAEPSYRSFEKFVASNAGSESFFLNTANGRADKPEGVLFGMDRRGEYYLELAAARKEGRADEAFMQSLEKKYPSWPVVGLFQFNASRISNISPCILQWNEINSQLNKPSSCQINRGNGTAIFTSFSSHGQGVNAFCGVQKIVQSFNSQVNTIHPTGVDRSNVDSAGRMQRPSNRCVSLPSRSGSKRIYSHFGPFRNSVGYNLKRVLECTSRALNGAQ